MLVYIIALLLFYYVIQVLWVKRTPCVITANNQRIKNLISQCSSLTQPYTPTFWCPTGRFITIMSSVIRDVYSRPYHYNRETLQTADGGSLSIDWSIDHESVSQSGKPIVIFLAGIINNSQANYIIESVKYLRAKNWGCAVYVYRGRGDTEVLTPITYWTMFFDDIEQIISVIKKRYPKSQISLVGFSLGAMNVFNYLCEARLSKDICAGVCISMPWNPFVSSEQLYSGIDYWLFNRVISSNLREFARSHFSTLQQLGVTENEVDEISLIKHSDNLFVTKMGGYKSVYDYYIDGGPAFKLGLVKTPILAINALDDPFSFPAGIPEWRELRKFDSPLAIAQYPFGGHMGFSSNAFASDFFLTSVLFDFIQQAASTTMSVHDSGGLGAPSRAN